MITHIHIDIIRDAVVVLIASGRSFLRANRQSRRELRWVGVCNHGCHWTTYFSSLGELVNPLQSNVHVAAHSYSMYQKASRVVSVKLTSTSHLNRTCPLPLHQAAAVIFHRQYWSYYRNTLLPCTAFSQQIPMLMSQSCIHLAAHSYSMCQEVDESCHSNSLPLHTKSKF